MLPVAAAAAAVPVVKGVASAVSGVGDALGLGGSDPEKDKGRIAALDVAFQRALTGDVAAAMFIRHRTGDYGAATIPGYGLVSSGGSAPSETHARQLWSSLKKQAPQVADQARTLSLGQQDTKIKSLPDEVVDPTNLGKEPTHDVQPIASASLGSLAAPVIVGLILFWALMRDYRKAGS